MENSFVNIIDVFRSGIITVQSYVGPTVLSTGTNLVYIQDLAQ